ncbi:MAG: CPXCG motif-containing cysteine-rich protein [Bacteroidota bacterium]
MDEHTIDRVPGGFSYATSLFWRMDFYGTFFCSFCGEENEIFVEPEDGEVQALTVDCSVCCRPNVLHIRIINQQIIIESEFEG